MSSAKLPVVVVPPATLGGGVEPHAKYSNKRSPVEMGITCSLVSRTSKQVLTKVAADSSLVSELPSHRLFSRIYVAKRTFFACALARFIQMGNTRAADLQRSEG